jgi:catechol 2,3-dioxygenase-like lactoylglutathione lyase family enzyme
MIDHISFSVNNFDESVKFYDETLKILGYERLMNFNDAEHKVAGYGKEGKPSFWIGEATHPNLDEYIGRARGCHTAFLAPDEHAINKWYLKAIELGAKDNGAPGPRTEYHPGFYGAFVVDPNGWRIEAVFHNFEER